MGASDFLHIILAKFFNQTFKKSRRYNATLSKTTAPAKLSNSQHSLKILLFGVFTKSNYIRRFPHY
jgi:hypothetical protein